METPTQGKWIPSQPVELAKEWKCTNCQELVYTSEFVSECDYEYCPNCGSKNRKNKKSNGNTDQK